MARGMLDSKMEIWGKVGLWFLAVVGVAHGQATLACVPEDTSAPLFIDTAMWSSNETMNVADCCETCLKSGYSACGVSEAAFCQCSNEAIATGAACTIDLCVADSKPCGSIADASQVDAYESGGGPPDFTMVVDDTAAPMSIVITYTASTEVFYINFGDGTPVVLDEIPSVVVAPDSLEITTTYYATVLPGNYTLSVIGKIPGTSLSFSSQTDLQPINADPSVDVVECPQLREPDIPYFCNVSVTYMNDAHSYKANFGGNIATVDLSGVGNVFRQVGIPVPKGTSDEVAATGALATDVIQLLQYPLTRKAQIIALDFLPIGDEDLIFEYMTPTCPDGTFYCVFLDSCEAVCPFDTASFAFSCAETLCTAQDTCGAAGSCSVATGTPAAWTSTLLHTAAGAPIDHTRKHVTLAPVDVEPGTHLKVTGPLARRSSLGPNGDTVNDVATTWHHYVSMTVKEIITVPILHVCLEIMVNVSLEVVDDLDPLNLLAAEDTMCERNITDLELDINQTDTDLYDGTLNLANPYYVRTEYPFDLMTIFPVAGPIRFDLNFTPPNDLEATEEFLLDYPLTGAPHLVPIIRTIDLEGDYYLEVSAFNSHNVLPDELTGVPPGPVVAGITIHAQNMISPLWTIAPLNDFNGAFLVPKEDPTFVFVDGNGWLFPTNATVSIDWGDGTPFEEFPFADPGNKEPEFVHHYTIGDDYSITANITNLVSGEFDITTTITIYEQIIDFDITNMYFPSETAVVGRPGFGRTGNQYPMDKNLTFFPSMSQGTVETYLINFTTNGSLIQSYEVADKFLPTADYFNYHFDFQTFLNITVIARNIFEDVPVDLFLEIVGQLRGLQVDDYSVVTEGGEEKTFEVTCESVGGGTCIVIDFGDGSPLLSFGEEPTCLLNFSHAIYDPDIMLDISMNITHTYADNDIYNITAFGYNEVSRDSDMLMFPVTDLDCAPPQVDILGQTLDYLSSPMLFKGKQNVFMAVGSINCALTQKTKKRWQLFNVDEESGQLMPAVIVMDIISSWDKPEFVLPPAFLHYGYFMALYTLTMFDPEVPILNEWIFQKQAPHFFLITKTPLIAKYMASSVSRVARGLEQSLLLEPAVYTEDPDFPDVKNFTIKWRCKVKGEDYPDPIPVLDITPVVPTGTGCFGYGPGYMNYDLRSLDMKGSEFRAVDETYQIEALVTKDTRTGPVTIDLFVTTESVPVLEVKCTADSLCRPSEDGVGVYVNPNLRMGVMVECVLACDELLTYTWSVLDTTDTAIPITDPSRTPVGTDKKEFSLAKEFFEDDPNLKDFSVHIDVLNMATPPSVGFSTYFMKVNQRPEQGTCDLDKYVGSAMIDPFELICSGWIDPESKGIEAYVVRLLSPGEEASTLVEQRHTSLPEQIIDLILPVGVFTMEITIADVWGATTLYQISTPVTVNMITEEQFNDFDSAAVMAGLLGGGNSAMITMLANARNSIINEADWLDLNDPSLTQEELEDRMRAINDLHTQSVSAMHEALNFMTLASTEAALGVLAEIMTSASNTPNDCLTLDMDTRNDFLDILERMIENIGDMEIGDPEQLRLIMEKIAAIAGGLVVVVEEVTEPDATRVPPRDTDDAHNKFYDTDIGYDIEMTIPFDLKDAKNHNMKDLANQNTLTRMPRLEKILDTMNAYILSKQVTGESINVTSKNNMTLVNGIMYSLAGTHYAGKSWIEFPDGLCPQGNCSDPVGLSLREWPTITFKATKSANVLSGGSRILDVITYNRDAEPLTVHDSPDVIKLGLYRTFNKRGNMTGPANEFVNATYETLYQRIPIMYTKFEIDRQGSGVNLEITPKLPGHKLFIMINKPRLPTLTNHSFFKMVEDIPADADGMHSMFLSTTEMEGTGIYYLGVGEFTPAVSNFNARNPILKEASLSWLQNMTVDYDLRVLTTGCYYYDPVINDWIPTEMEVVGSTYEFARCDSTHLTSFGSGMFAMPNTIDFSFVFANMGFADNLTIYVTLILCLCLFAVLMVWARFQDRKDLQKLGAAPLPDNLADDKYLYEILVFTGNKKQAQTDSVVQFELAGDYATTEVRTLGDDRRKILQKASVDVFVMAVPKPLGPLNFLRIWHDNSGVGPNSSWFLSYIVFRDIQTGEKFEFISNQWFALESNDGQIERAIGVAGTKEKAQFGHLFHNTSNKNLVDGHLWFSVFMRPPRSRFTRCQRVGSCFSLLFLSMLVNAMWYDTVPSQPTTGGINIGPFSLSPEQIGVGVMSNLIVFPPSFLIVFMFRKSRPKVLRKSRIQEALKRASDETQKKKGLNNEGEDEGSGNEEGNKGQEERTNKGQEEAKQDLDKKKTEEEDDDLKKKKKKKKKFTFPWICTYIAWLLVVLIVIVAVFFLLMYGVMFGNEKATKWLMALIISFFSSVLFVQPMKVFLSAMLMSMIFKSSDIDEDDADEDEENPELEKNELWLYDGEPSKKLGFGRLDKELLEELRKRRLKEIEMWSIIMELVVYAFFIWILLILSYGQRDANAWYLQNSLRNTFIHDGAIDGTDFNLVANTDMFWLYLHTGFMTELRADVMYNGDAPYHLRGFLNDYANRIMGYGTIRQIRGKRNACAVPNAMENATDQCSGFTKVVYEESRNYCRGWKIPTTATQNTPDCQVREFRYSTAAELSSLPFWGQSDWYGGGGYVIHLQGPTGDILETFSFLQENHWIDHMTRAVLIEFATYNSQVNLFGICTIVAEVTPGGGIRPYYRFDAINLLQHHDNFGSFVIACEIIFIIFTIYFTIHEFRLLCKQRMRYFDSYWSYAELAIILVSYLAIGLYLARYFEVDSVLDTFNRTYGNGYIKMTYAATMDESFGYMVAFLVFVGTLKFIKLLRFNKRMGILSATLKQCWDDLSGFLMAFGICFASFVLMFYFLLSAQINGFSNFISALETSFSMMMGKFQFNEMKEVNSMVPIMFFVFVLSTSWVLVNLLLTLIIKSFEQVKNDMLKQPNEYEMVDFVFSRFKAFIGMNAVMSKPLPPQRRDDDEDDGDQKEGAQKSHEKSNVDELPSKVDTFLEYINTAYYGGTMNLKSKGLMKDSLQAPKRVILGGDSDAGREYQEFVPRDRSKDTGDENFT